MKRKKFSIPYDSKKKKILSIGAALIDLLLKENYDFLESLEAQIGGMFLKDKNFIEETILKSENKTDIVTGGSACNTIMGLGKLGADAYFSGKLGIDDYGILFEKALEKNNVKPNLIKTNEPTGRVLSIITPDAQRTMFTFLGASSLMKPSEIKRDFFKDTGIVYMEGYLAYNKEVFMKILEEAKNEEAFIALDLSSFTVVEESKIFLKSIIKNFVDILIANEDEAKAYTDLSDEKTSVLKMAEEADLAVLKLGAKGSLIAYENRIININAEPIEDVIDTTGAGDLWAAGFLFGIINGFDLKRCGEIASCCGSEVCRVIGAQVPEKCWKKIKERFCLEE